MSRQRQQGEVQFSFGPSEPDGIERLARIVGGGGFDVLIIDTARAIGHFEENDSGDVRRFVNLLRDLVLAPLNCTIVLAHHVTKLGEDSEKLFDNPTRLMEKVRGSGDWVASADSVMFTMKIREGHQWFENLFTVNARQQGATNQTFRVGTGPNGVFECSWVDAVSRLGQTSPPQFAPSWSTLRAWQRGIPRMLGAVSTDGQFGLEKSRSQFGSSWST